MEYNKNLRRHDIVGTDQVTLCKYLFLFPANHNIGNIKQVYLIQKNIVIHFLNGNAFTIATLKIMCLCKALVKSTYLPTAIIIMLVQVYLPTLACNNIVVVGRYLPTLSTQSQSCRLRFSFRMPALFLLWIACFCMHCRHYSTLDELQCDVLQVGVL